MDDKRNAQQVLGGLMLHPQYLSEIDKYNLSVSDFSSLLERYIFTAIGGLSIVLTILLYGFVRPLTYLLQVPAETVEDMVTYLIYVFAGFFAIFLYNYFASILRSIGNSVLPWQPLSPST